MAPRAGYGLVIYGLWMAALDHRDKASRDRNSQQEEAQTDTFGEKVLFFFFNKYWRICLFWVCCSSDVISMSDYKCKDTQRAEVINRVKWFVISNKYNIYFQLLL